jgi:hypothetical protein
MTQPTAPLAWTNGHVTVNLAQLESGVWHVQTTVSSGFVLEAWSHSYPNEDTARSAARHAATAFRQWGTPKAVADEDARLRFVVRDLLNSRLDTRQQMADTEASISAIEDLNSWGTLALIAA